MVTETEVRAMIDAQAVALRDLWRGDIQALEALERERAKTLAAELAALIGTEIGKLFRNGRSPIRALEEGQARIENRMIALETTTSARVDQLQAAVEDIQREGCRSARAAHGQHRRSSDDDDDPPRGHRRRSDGGAGASARDIAPAAEDKHAGVWGRLSGLPASVRWGIVGVLVGSGTITLKQLLDWLKGWLLS